MNENNKKQINLNKKKNRTNDVCFIRFYSSLSFTFIFTELPHNIDYKNIYKTSYCVVFKVL